MPRRTGAAGVTWRWRRRLSGGWGGAGHPRFAAAESRDGHVGKKLFVEGEPDGEDSGGDERDHQNDLEPARELGGIKERTGILSVGFGRDEGGSFEASLRRMRHGSAVDSYYGWKRRKISEGKPAGAESRGAARGPTSKDAALKAPPRRAGLPAAGGRGDTFKSQEMRPPERRGGRYKGDS
jgi:hypothetical protein